MPASAAAASVTPSSMTVGRDLRHGHRIGGQLHGGRGHLGHRDRDVTVEPGRDVIGPADADPFGRQHLVDPLDHLRVEGLVEIDALDRREASEQLAQGCVLLRRRLEPHLDEERRVGGNVGSAGANGSRTRVQQEASGRDADRDGKDAHGADDGDSPGGRSVSGSNGGGHGSDHSPRDPALGSRTWRKGTPR